MQKTRLCRSSSASLCAFFLLTLSACATARVVEVYPGKGGVISLSPPQSPEAREKAKALMSDGCQGKKSTIVKEGEVVVGQKSEGEEESTQEDKRSTNLFTGKTSSKPMGKTRSSSTTSNLTEWRITYRCK